MSAEVGGDAGSIRTGSVVQPSLTLIVDTAAVAARTAWAAGCDPSLPDGRIRKKHCPQENAVRFVTGPGPSVEAARAVAP
jgi:hypothetical protein